MWNSANFVQQKLPFRKNPKPHPVFEKTRSNEICNTWEGTDSYVKGTGCWGWGMKNLRDIGSHKGPGFLGFLLHSDMIWRVTSPMPTPHCTRGSRPPPTLTKQRSYWGTSSKQVKSQIDKDISKTYVKWPYRTFLHFEDSKWLNS